MKKGHGGIFEVRLNDKAIFDNKNECGNLPAAEDIFTGIRAVLAGNEEKR